MSSIFFKLKFLAKLPWKSNLKPLSRNLCDVPPPPCKFGDDEDPKNKQEARMISKKEIFMTREAVYDKCRHSQNIEVCEPSKIDTFNGVPEEHVLSRRVRITHPTKNAMQSGTYNTEKWQMEFETRERWENPLMGWTSSGDPLSNMVLQFPTKEATIAFCKKNCWPYYVDVKPKKQTKSRNYAALFAWNRRCRASTK